MNGTKSRAAGAGDGRRGPDRVAPGRFAAARGLAGADTRQPGAADPPRREARLAAGRRRSSWRPTSATAAAVRRRWTASTSSSTRRPMAATCRRSASTSRSTVSGRRNCWRSSATRTCRFAKVIVASSQAVYSEGAAHCPRHGLVFPTARPVAQLRAGDFAVHCPICGALTTPDADARGRADRRRDGLRHHQGRPGAPGAHLGPADRHPDRGAALLLHLRPAPVDLQSLYRRDRDFHDPAAERPAAGALRGRRADARLLLRRGHRARQPAGGAERQARGLPVNIGSGRATTDPRRRHDARRAR